MKKLIDLNPAFVSAGGEGVTDFNGLPVPERKGIGLACDCPCGCGRRMYVGFENPLDGGSCLQPARPNWRRFGDTFEELTLHPSIQRADPDGCGWHGHLINGAFVR